MLWGATIRLHSLKCTTPPNVSGAVRWPLPLQRQNREYTKLNPLVKRVQCHESRDTQAHARSDPHWRMVGLLGRSVDPRTT